MATIASVLVAFCEAVRAKAKVEVLLGRPDEAVPGVYVWPWGLSEDPNLRNPPGSPGPGAGRSPHAGVPPVVHVLLLVRPALTLEGHERLGAAREAILGAPVLQVDRSNVRVTIRPLDVDQLSKLFAAASLALSICLSAELQWTE